MFSQADCFTAISFDICQYLCVFVWGGPSLVFLILHESNNISNLPSLLLLLVSMMDAPTPQTSRAPYNFAAHAGRR